MISLKMNTRIYQNTHTQVHSPFPSSESQFAFFWGYYKYFNASWLQSNPLQLLAAILNHPCHKFHGSSRLCFYFYYDPIQTRHSGALQGLHPDLSAAAGTSAPNGSLLFIACAAGVPSSRFPRRSLLLGSSLCCQQLTQRKKEGNPRLGTNRSSTKGSWDVRWQLSVTSLQHDCPWALKLPNVFPALRGLSALSPPHRSQGHLARGALWGSGPTGSDSISSLSVVL